MDIQFFGLISVGLLLFLTFVVFWWSRGSHYLIHKRLPPGSRGLPFVGETLHYYYSSLSAQPNTFFEERVKSYGDLFKTHLFGSDAICSTDPEFVKFVLVNEGKLFEADYLQSSRDLFGKYALINLHGILHKKFHGLAVNLVNPEKLRRYFMEDIETHALKILESWTDREVFLDEELKHFSMSIIAQQMLSFKRGNETEYLHSNSDNIAHALLSLPVNIPWTTYYKGLRARKRMKKLLFQVLDDRRTQQPAGNPHTDLLAMLMAWDEFPLTDEQIVDLSQFILVVGSETSNTIITCMITFLADCPRALAQIREEHDSVPAYRRANERLTWEDYKGMTFTRNVIKETLRIANAVPMAFRKALQDVDIKGYTIPKGWKVFVPLLGMHMREDLFQDAMKFNPWRWEEKDTRGETFMPFGAGSRLCPGSHLAMLEASIFLHHLVTKFEFELASPASLCWYPWAIFPDHVRLKIRVRNNVNARSAAVAPTA